MRLSIEDSALKVRLSLLEKVLSVRGSFRIPLDHIAGASTWRPRTTWREIRASGSYVPGVIKAGTYFTGRGREFWYTTRGDRVLNIELNSGFYRRLVLTLDGNQEWADRINATVGSRYTLT